MNLHEELPYHLMVETESWKEGKDGSVTVHQVITVSRDSHKIIVLGSRGEMIKKVSIEARAEIESALEIKVHLFLFVKVRGS